MKKYVIFIFFAFLCYTLNAQIVDEQPELLKIESITPTPASCNYSVDGTATIVISGGEQPYTYSVNNRPPVTRTEPQYSVSGLTKGDHHVRVVDVNGYTTEDTFTVGSFQSFSATAGQSKWVRCDPTGGAISVQVLTEEGVLDEFRYKLNGDGEWQESPEFVGLLTGETYTVIVADDNGNGCEVMIENIILSKAKTEVTVTGNNVQCWGGVGSLVAEVTVEDDLDRTPGIVYHYHLYMNGYSYSDDVSSGNFYNLSAGNYTVRVKDSYGCEYEGGATVVEPESALGLILTDTQPPQGGDKGSITVTTKGGWGGYTIVCIEIGAGYYQKEIARLTDVTVGDYTFGNLEGFRYMFLISDKGGCIAPHLDIDMGPPTGGIDVESSGLKIFPNPSGDGLFIIEWNNIGDRKVTLEVFNMSGQLIYKTNAQTGARTTLDVSAQRRGAYLLRVPELNISQKIVIE